MNFYAEAHELFSLHGLASLLILSLLELVLGIDNIIFISLAITNIPEEKRFGAKVTALSLAFVMRIILLFCIVWLARITSTLFTVSNFQVSLRDILFFMGGAYLTFSTVKELMKHINNKKKEIILKKNIHKSIILQIALVDILFSFDSIFTAIGVIPNFIIMALAVAVGMVFMIYLSGQISRFIEKHPTVKTLALCFIIAVGLMLVTEALHLEIPKEYFYLAFIIAILFEGAKGLIKKGRN